MPIKSSLTFPHEVQIAPSAGDISVEHALTHAYPTPPNLPPLETEGEDLLQQQVLTGLKTTIDSLDRESYLDRVLQAYPPTF